MLKWIDADELSGATFVFKFNDAFNQGKKRIVFAATNVLSGLPFGTALAREYVAANNVFAAKLLQAQSLRRRVATVSR